MSSTGDDFLKTLKLQQNKFVNFQSGATYPTGHGKSLETTSHSNLLPSVFEFGDQKWRLEKSVIGSFVNCCVHTSTETCLE